MTRSARPAGGRRARVGILPIAVVLLLLASCERGENGEAYQPRQPVATPTGVDSRLIGLVGTFSGPDAWRGEDAFEGADVAVGDLNRNLEEGEPHYELVSFDDEGDGELSVELVEEAAAEDRMAGIVYAGPPEGLPNAEGALAEAGIPAILVYGDLYGARALSPHVFQASPSYRWEARRIGRYLVSDRRYEQIGGLVSGSPDGSTAQEALEEGLRLAGGPSPHVQLFAPRAQGFDGQLDRLEARRVEAIVVQGNPSEFASILEALADRGATYRSTDAARTLSAPKKVRKRKDRPWRPQVLGFDLAMAPRDDRIPAGTVVADSYARGSHYLPIPSLKSFRKAFSGWWDAPPTGWEQRSFDAVQAIGWADRTATGSQDRAHRLEKMKGVRYGGLDVTLGPDDHTLVEATTVGLWVSPGPGDAREMRKLPASLPWVPLSRGFSIDGDRTDILESDWKYLFRDAPVKGAPAPPLEKMRFGVNSSRRDPLH